MKYAAIILLAAIASLAAVSCHKAKNSAVATHTNATPNVADSIDSAAVIAQNKTDVYSGMINNNGSGSLNTIFKVVHLLPYTINHPGVAIFQSVDLLQINSGLYLDDTRTQLNDTFSYYGAGHYTIGGISVDLGNGSVGDSLNMSWQYEIDHFSYTDDHKCIYKGVCIK